LRGVPIRNKLIDAALAQLALEGTTLYYSHQNVAELWNAMPRPIARNGFGLTVAEADREVKAIEAGMTLLPNNEATYREWRRIVVRHAVSGVQVYDARLAATLLVHGIRHILTLNVADFSRYRSLTAIHPSSI